MRPISYSSDVVQGFLQEHLVASLDQLKSILGTNATSTVLRRLRDLGYLSSYSHRGSFYTLTSVPQFDAQGLWHHNEASFSKYGNLVDTCQALVKLSQSGFSVGDLDNLLGVETKRPLRQLHRNEVINRSKFDGVYIYFSGDSKRERIQQKLRSSQTDEGRLDPKAPAGTQPEEVKAAIILFFSILDEKQRRLFAGLESLKRGHGGDSFIAQLLGIDPHTVAKGRRELTGDEIDFEGIRQTGGGRKSVEKKRPKSSPK